jgi:hypothetical protein
MTLSTTRSKIVSESNDFIPAIKYRERSTLATSSSPLRPAPKLNDIFTQKRNLHTDLEGTDGETSKKENRKAYRNRHGEEIVFSPCYPPQGYVFVSSGNTFITRSCRKVAQKLYVVYRPESRKKPFAQIGLHVQKEVFEKAKSDFKAKRARSEEILWRALDKNYPQMPPADKNELYHLISSRCPSLIGKSVLNHSGPIIYAYVRDQYTPFKSLAPYGDTEAIDQAHKRVQEILASWRGEE